MTKLTDWFPGHIKPVRIGVYQQRNYVNLIGYQRWDGQKWYEWHISTIHAANSDYLADPLFQNDSWRGLTAPTPKDP